MDPRRQTQYGLIHNWILTITIKQFTKYERVDNKENPQGYMWISQGRGNKRYLFDEPEADGDKNLRYLAGGVYSLTEEQI